MDAGLDSSMQLLYSGVVFSDTLLPVPDWEQHQVGTQPVSVVERPPATLVELMGGVNEQVQGLEEQLSLQAAAAKEEAARTQTIAASC